MNANRKQTILLIDDHALFRASLRRALEEDTQYSVVDCGSAADALAILDRQKIDIVLLDYDLGTEMGPKFVPSARQHGFNGPILIVTAWLSEEEAARLMRAGVAGIFLKESPLESLIEAVRTVAQGGAWLHPRYLRLALGAPLPADDHTTFSHREREILGHLLKGAANKEIADQLGISESAVKASLQRLFQKTGTRTRAQLVRVALEKQLRIKN